MATQNTTTDRRGIADLELMPWPLPAFDVTRAQHAISRSTVYRARCGIRPAFHSMADAMEYERGFRAYPDSRDIAIDTPSWTGYFDAERSQQLRDEARADQAFEEQAQ